MQAFSYTLDHRDCLKIAEYLSHIPGTSLYWSGGNLDSALTSFLWAFPYVSIEVKASSLFINGQYVKTCHNENVWDELTHEVEKEKQFGFGWNGFLGYEMGYYCSSKLYSIIDDIRQHEVDTPDAYIQRCAFALRYDKATHTATIAYWPEAASLLNPEFLPYFLDCANDPEKFIRKALQTSLSDQKFSQKVIQSFENKTQYIDKIIRVKDEIRSGNVYQLNLSQEMIVTSPKNHFRFFDELTSMNPSPFSVFIRLNSCSIVSSSPERLICHRNGILETRPIKGTRPRGKTEEQDEQMRRELVASEKENAELLMITDLMRNDLSKISTPASVRYRGLRVEEYHNVFHRVALIDSCAKKMHPLLMLKEIFPGGSITGCPKIRAMQEIAKLEKRKRGIYTGSIGYIMDDSSFDFNIAIRTCVMNESKLAFAVGGGIVWDSDPFSEYQETVHKASSILHVLGINPEQYLQ